MSIHFKQNGRLHIINRLQIREPANKVQWRARNFAHIGHFTGIILLK
jgi:hypothetical protein